MAAKAPTKKPTDSGTKYKVYFRDPGLETTLTLGDGRVIRLIGDDEGMMRQIRGRIADPQIEEKVAETVRSMRGWSVEAWPAGYQPAEEVVAIGATSRTGGFHEAILQEETQSAARRAMLDRLSAINKPRGRKAQEEAGDEEGADDTEGDRYARLVVEDSAEIEELTTQIISLSQRLAGVVAERDEALRQVGRLEAKLEQQSRTVTPPLPGPGGDRKGPPTAKDMGKGKNLRESLEDAGIDPTTQGLPAAEDGLGEPVERVDAIAGATEGIARS